ncbi:MAG: ACT domain-containing protein [Gammaproteobacteria bacterium]|nr:ACT domain-containing protein [Gammaproteobacteria bacterium]
MNEQLVITALGKDRPGIVNELSNALASHQLNIEDSSMSVMGGEFAILMLVSGSVASIDNFIAQITELEERLGMHLLAKSTSTQPTDTTYALYTVEIDSIDRPGIVRDIASFFSDKQINIVDLDTLRYPAAHTGIPMFTMQMTIGVPPEQSIVTLREEFISLCNTLNIDADINTAL